MSTQETKIPQTGEGQNEPCEQNGDAAMRPGAAVARDQDAEQALVLRVPETARIPEGATFYEGTDDGKCRVIIRDERCRASRMRLYGLCPGHAGQGGIARDPVGNSKLAHAERSRKKAARLSLGITARRAAQPLQAARVAAQLRANDYARAVVDAPLDDPELGSVARQQAAIRALELLYPQVHASLDLSLPEEPDQVGAMGWQEMQAMAAQLLGDAGDQQ